jgi:hypothetical protein
MENEIGKIVVGIVVAQFGGVIAFFVSLKVQQAKQEVIVERLIQDVNNLGRMIRDQKQENENA